MYALYIVNQKFESIRIWVFLNATTKIYIIIPKSYSQISEKNCPINKWIKLFFVILKGVVDFPEYV